MFQKAAERGNAEAQSCLGVYYSKVGEVSKSLEWLRRVANQGHRNEKRPHRNFKFDL